MFNKYFFSGYGNMSLVIVNFHSVVMNDRQPTAACLTDNFVTVGLMNA